MCACRKTAKCSSTASASFCLLAGYLGGLLVACCVVVNSGWVCEEVMIEEDGIMINVFKKIFLFLNIFVGVNNI